MHRVRRFFSHRENFAVGCGDGVMSVPCDMTSTLEYQRGRNKLPVPLHQMGSWAAAFGSESASRGGGNRERKKRKEKKEGGSAWGGPHRRPRTPLRSAPAPSRGAASARRWSSRGPAGRAAPTPKSRAPRMPRRRTSASCRKRRRRSYPSRRGPGRSCCLTDTGWNEGARGAPAERMRDESGRLTHRKDRDIPDL